MSLITERFYKSMVLFRNHLISEESNTSDLQATGREQNDCLGPEAIYLSCRCCVSHSCVIAYAFVEPDAVLTVGSNGGFSCSI